PLCLAPALADAFPYTTLFRSTRRCTHGHHHLRELRFGQVHIEIRARSVERLHQELLPFLPELGRVVLARGVDQARDEALERITRSEEHTSELQSPDHLVCRLL